MDRNDVKAQVGKAGGSLSEIAKTARIHPSSCSHALDYPIPSANRAIAKFLGKSVHELWPEWFDKNGKRRPGVSSATLRQPRSSQKRKAA